MKTTWTGRPAQMCRFIGGDLDGKELLIPLGVSKVRIPKLMEGGLGAVEYTVTWHDDGPVAQ